MVSSPFVLWSSVVILSLLWVMFSFLSAIVSWSLSAMISCQRWSPGCCNSWWFSLSLSLSLSFEIHNDMTTVLSYIAFSSSAGVKVEVNYMFDQLICAHGAEIRDTRFPWRLVRDTVHPKDVWNWDAKCCVLCRTCGISVPEFPLHLYLCTKFLIRIFGTEIQTSGKSHFLRHWGT